MIQPGLLTPPVVCGSTAVWPDRASARIYDRAEALVAALAVLQDRDVLFVGANTAYDLALLVNEVPAALEAVFAALAEGRVHDVLVCQALDAIASGHLGRMPDGRKLTNAKGKQTDRYDLDLCVRINLHRHDAKERDYWRTRYKILSSVPVAEYPEDAQQYPRDDTWNAVEVAAKQLGVPAAPPPAMVVYGDPVLDDVGDSWLADGAGKTPAAPPDRFRNLADLPAQVETAFALHLGAIWGLRTDGLAVQLLELRAAELHAVYVRRFAALGLYRLNKVGAQMVAAAGLVGRPLFDLAAFSPAPVEESSGDSENSEDEEGGGVGDDGEVGAALLARLGYSRDTAAVARAVAIAYGARNPCPRCGGTGRVQTVKRVPCRGIKVRGRYQGCLLTSACPCVGSGVVDKVGGEVLCRAKHGGCEGTGFDIDPAKVPALPRTEKGGVSASRDTLMESGDDDLSAFGQNKQAKILRTYAPRLREGVDRPLTFDANVLLETGRASYHGIVQLLPRWTLSGFDLGSEGFRKAVALAEAAGRPDVVRSLWAGWVPSPRECFVARPGRVLGSTDYAALELVCLAQACLWIVKESRMAEIINATKQPGHLHSALGARLMGISFEEMLARLDAKDKVAKAFRQAAKPVSFGLPGGMKAARLVLASREEKNGTTPGPDGTEYAGIRFCVLIGGQERCGVEKVMVWNRQVIPPTCLACLRIAQEQLIPAWFREYPEMEDYFRFVERELEITGAIPHLGPWLTDEAVPIAERKPHRVRGGCGFRDGANGIFQGLAADGAKDAYRHLTREAYLDKQSVLYEAQARFPALIHDEVISELDEELAHLAGPRIAEVMIARMRVWVPDVYVAAETALMRAWNKDAEPVYAVPCGTADAARLAALGWKDDAVAAAVRKERAVFDGRAKADAFVAAQVAALGAAGGATIVPRLVPWAPKEFRL